MILKLTSDLYMYVHTHMSMHIHTGKRQRELGVEKVEAEVTQQSWSPHSCNLRLFCLVQPGVSRLLKTAKITPAPK